MHMFYDVRLKLNRGILQEHFIIIYSCHLHANDRIRRDNRRKCVTKGDMANTKNPFIILSNEGTNEHLIV
jgi:hypothetical protein